MPNMTKTREQIKSEYKFTDALVEAKSMRKGTNGITKTSVTVHKSGDDATADGSGSILKSPSAPDATQLAAINKFTRSPKSADELYVFNTLSANTLPDRDDDYFDKETLTGFSELEGALSSVGKAYMVSHDYSKLPQGRIFDVGMTKAFDADFLTHQVYVPNTEANQKFIEDVDFGVNWAVSVGVLLEAQLCGICQENQYGFWGMALCETGHWKGEYYDPEEDRTDDWGDIIPARENDPKAVKCLGNMHGAKDFYELSQCFLGAQYFAALDTKNAKGIVKSFGDKTKHIPVLGLSRADRKELDIPLQHTNPKVAEALLKYTVDREDDGSMSWQDDEKLIWQFTPGDEVLCLGKEVEKDDDEDKEIEDGTSEAAEREAGGAGQGGSPDPVGGPDDPGSAHQEGAEGDDPSLEPDEAGGLGSDGNLTDPTGGTDDNEKEAKSMSKKVVLRAVKGAGLPAVFTNVLVEADEDKALDVVLRTAADQITSLTTQVSELTSKSTLGDKFLKGERAKAIAAYVKFMSIGKTAGVSTTNFEKMLDNCGDDVELIQSMTNDYDSQVRALLSAPKSRSSVDPDPNERQHGGSMGEEEGHSSPRASRTVSRIHG